MRHSLSSRLLISNSPHELIFSLWAWSAHWFAWHSCNLWDSSSRVSQRATSELFCSHLLISISASASESQFWAAFSPRTAGSAFGSRFLWRFRLSNEVRTLFESRSLFLLNTDSSTLATQLLPHTRSPMLKNEPAIESLPRTRSPVLRTEPKFNNVGTVLAAECWLLLATNRWGRWSKSSEAATVFVRSSSRMKLSFLDGKLIGVCSLTNVDAEVWLITCGGMSCSQRPPCPSSWRSAQGVGLIPVSVSGEGVQDGGGVEQKEDRAGTPRRDMMCGENVLLGGAQDTSIIKETWALAQSWATRTCCACVERWPLTDKVQNTRTEKNMHPSLTGESLFSVSENL